MKQSGDHADRKNDPIPPKGSKCCRADGSWAHIRMAWPGPSTREGLGKIHRERRSLGVDRPYQAPDPSPRKSLKSFPKSAVEQPSDQSGASLSKSLLVVS